METGEYPLVYGYQYTRERAHVKDYKGETNFFRNSGKPTEEGNLILTQNPLDSVGVKEFQLPVFGVIDRQRVKIDEWLADISTIISDDCRSLSVVRIRDKEDFEVKKVALMNDLRGQGLLESFEGPAFEIPLPQIGETIRIPRDPGRVGQLHRVLCFKGLDASDQMSVFKNLWVKKGVLEEEGVDVKWINEFEALDQCREFHSLAPEMTLEGKREFRIKGIHELNHRTNEFKDEWVKMADFFVKQNCDRLGADLMEEIYKKENPPLPYPDFKRDGFLASTLARFRNALWLN